jgi:hypothetical protein
MENEQQQVPHHSFSCAFTDWLVGLHHAKSKSRKQWRSTILKGCDMQAAKFVQTHKA